MTMYGGKGAELVKLVTMYENLMKSGGAIAPRLRSMSY